MARSDNQKRKLMLLARLLEQQTDEAHPMSAQQLIAALAEHGIKAERKSIYSDIAALQDLGMDICLQNGKNGGYYLASREFELPELKLLVDAVQASKFLSERKTVQRNAGEPVGCRTAAAAGGRFRARENDERERFLHRGSNSRSHCREPPDPIPLF